MSYLHEKPWQTAILDRTAPPERATQLTTNASDADEPLDAATGIAFAVVLGLIIWSVILVALVRLF